MSKQWEHLRALAEDVVTEANANAGYGLAELSNVALAATFNGAHHWMATISTITWADDTPEAALEGLASQLRRY